MSRVSMKLKPIGIRCITVGDSAVGKTCLLIRECMNVYPEDYVPTVFDSYIHEITVDNAVVKVQTEDARGRQDEDYIRLRPLCYINANVFVICFDLSNPTSYENVSKLWYPEIHEHCPDVPFILVGTKLDLKIDEDGNPKTTDDAKCITYEQGQEMKSKVGALGYFECSSLTGRGVNDEATCHGVSHRLGKKKKRKNCVVI
ncbi:ras-related C3 botulinum toxin substrate 1-like [Antedon mediterranea]|uniref:ras-related C3 botulinum toxin substrate 1-like n=1 Tax=Antedon mediterranea TaxID=105859 RepID=UPI003AF91E01